MNAEEVTTMTATGPTVTRPPNPPRTPVWVCSGDYAVRIA